MQWPAYRQMSCEDYSRLELAILRGLPLRMRWCGRGLVHIERVRARNLRTRRKAEYLLFEDQRGRRRCIRLDRILSFDELT